MDRGRGVKRLLGKSFVQKVRHDTIRNRVALAGPAVSNPTRQPDSQFRMITSIRPRSFFPNPFPAAPRAQSHRQVAAQVGPEPDPVGHHLKPLKEFTQAMNRLDHMLESPVFQPVE